MENPWLEGEISEGDWAATGGHRCSLTLSKTVTAGILESIHGLDHHALKCRGGSHLCRANNFANHVYVLPLEDSARLEIAHRRFLEPTY